MKAVVLSLVAALIVTAGCSSSPSSPSKSASGVISGVLDAVGGSAPGAPRPLPGTVTMSGQNGKPTTAQVGSDGSFSATVPAGHYTVTGRSPLYQNGQWDCVITPPSTVAVVAGQTTKVTLDCVEK